MLEQILQSLEDRAVLWNSINTGALVATVLIARSLALRSVAAKTKDNIVAYRQTRAFVRNVALVVTLLGATVIWANELKTLAISLVAVAAAIVIATKELILCVSGGFYRSTSRLFDVGDRIEVAGIRGDVVEMGVFSTLVMEIGPARLAHSHTGRAIHIPNAIFLASAVVNESYTDNFVLHTLVVPTKAAELVDDLEAALLAAANAECSTWIADARRHFERLSIERGIERVTVEPKTWISVPEAGKFAVIVRFPSPARRRGVVEQAILKRALPAISAFGDPSKTDDSDDDQ